MELGWPGLRERERTPVCTVVFTASQATLFEGANLNTVCKYDKSLCVFTIVNICNYNMILFPSRVNNTLLLIVLEEKQFLL